MNPILLADLFRCFQGVVPSILATSDGRGVPNITYVSQVYFVDERHVALSCQFFNKTRRNLDANPNAAAEVYDPVSMQAYRLKLRFLRSEKQGSLFDAMDLRIQAIASMTGMAGVFKLLAADVFEVLKVERVDGFLTTPAEPLPDRFSLEGLRSELRGLQWVSERINSAEDLESLLDRVLEALDTYFNFSHAMVLLVDETTQRLVTIASRGYGESGVGAEVQIGEGPIGTVARERRVLRLTGLHEGLRYGRAVRRELVSHESAASVTPEIPLPGLPDAQSMLIIPLSMNKRLIGVLAVESREAMGFGEWHEAYLEVVGNQIALGIDRMVEREPAADAPDVPLPVAAPAPPPVVAAKNKRTLVYYRNDDCVFVDGDYLIRNVPGRILWKLLGEWQRDGRTEFTNRELRLDEALGLPAIKDNLESRLILLRKRLEEKCPDLRLVSTGRGRFALQVAAAVEMVEK
ncbi:MAG TPA: GAF domain-containing protein [Thermoanaerobaculia bacterium]